jgi:putative restriction endonuclease
VSLAPLTATRLEKAAADNGFDRPLGSQGEWLAFGSNHAPLRVWLSVDHPGRPVVALSRIDVARALGTLGTTTDVGLPPGAAAARVAPGFDVLHELLRRGYQLARTLPDELLHVFQEKTKALPRATEAERLVVQRVGQDVFRTGLLEYWEGRCAVTGLAVPELLRASHIKPWAACETDAERLDVFNGLLLAPHLDALFDGGFITVADDGGIVLSEQLSARARALLGLASPVRVARLTDEHRAYLAWHRAQEFKLNVPGER